MHIFMEVCVPTYIHASIEYTNITGMYNTQGDKYMHRKESGRICQKTPTQYGVCFSLGLPLLPLLLCSLALSQIRTLKLALSQIRTLKIHVSKNDGKPC